MAEHRRADRAGRKAERNGGEQKQGQIADDVGRAQHQNGRADLADVVRRRARDRNAGRREPVPLAREQQAHDEKRQYAAEQGFDSFTSSLFISPYQKHDLMRETAEKAAAEFGVEFLYRDFRPYFRQGQERARELGFYMQKYCGCIFSEEERYLKASKIIP